ncbi:MAG: response regulator [Pirellulaceae bacterium]|nr:response regulator [Pirellulaceae bacterium]
MSDLPPTDPSEKKPHVLLVDDDAEIIESMRYALEANGFHVTIARDGNQGLALAENTTPDLLILDMMMPKRSGFLVLEQLRRNGHDKVRVIMVTGNEGNRHKQYAELLGVDDYIRKPFPMDRLIESALRLVSKSPGSSASGSSTSGPETSGQSETD